MNLDIDPEWLLRMADAEGNGIISVGGLITRIRKEREAMCYGCWEEYDKPAIDTPAVREAARAVGEIYEYSPVGGNLHIYLDDWNLEDCWFERDEMEVYEVLDAGPDQLAAERRCYGLLKALTEDERASALALHEGFWGGDS